MKKAPLYSVPSGRFNETLWPKTYLKKSRYTNAFSPVVIIPLCTEETCHQSKENPIEHKTFFLKNVYIPLNSSILFKKQTPT